MIYSSFGKLVSDQFPSLGAVYELGLWLPDFKEPPALSTQTYVITPPIFHLFRLAPLMTTSPKLHAWVFLIPYSMKYNFRNMKLTAGEVVKRLNKVKTRERAEAAAWYFKTGEGQYGHGDVFIGVTVPEQRKIARDFGELSLDELDKLLKNKIHECRLTALFILVGKYKSADKKMHDKIAKFYLNHKQYINNWDLVDSSACHILGKNLVDKNRRVLYKLVKSKNIWDRRIAIISTHSFIRRDDFIDAFAIATLLLKDKHDLIHKAVGWTLREVGKRSSKKLEDFLKLNASQMPRTMLRYAIERLSPAQRQFYLNYVI